MQWSSFHHPDISLPVIRRRVSTEILELMSLFAGTLYSGGWLLIKKHCFPNDAAYRNSVCRLKKQGLTAQRSVAGETPRLIISDEGKKLLPDYFTPDKFWNRKWNGIWYQLIYDIPESSRKYRNELRRFLKRMRLGNLQQSVWITPQDIRPEFEDLTIAANIDAFAYLFESRTVLGLSRHHLVQHAWNMKQLHDIQEHYCSITEQNIELMAQIQVNADELVTLLKQSLEAFHSAFADDPLLPSSLLPRAYLGKQAFELHCSLMNQIGQSLKACHLNGRPSV